MAYLRKGAEPPKKGKGSKLSTKMQRFVDEYMQDFVAYKAVLRAGYKTNNPENLAAELMHHPLVRREIDKRMAIRRDENELNAEYVTQKLIKMLEQNEENNPNAAIRCAELLGKYLGLFKERQEISGPDGGAIEMEQKVKESVEDFTSNLNRLIKRNSSNKDDNVVELRKEG